MGRVGSQVCFYLSVYIVENASKGQVQLFMILKKEDGIKAFPQIISTQGTQHCSSNPCLLPRPLAVPLQGSHPLRGDYLHISPHY